VTAQLTAPSAQTALPNPLRLHLGGKEVKEGWHILNVTKAPGVDFIGSCQDLSAFPDSCCDEMYASHVLEHLSHAWEFLPALQGFHRVLKPGGIIRISVPDMDVLCWLLQSPALTLTQRYVVMTMMFGGQTDDFDYHKIGLNFPILQNFLQRAGFREITKVPEFGIFKDSSSLRSAGALISLNVTARK
jgi:predicted SAM-dependent methyltransferase